MSLSELQTIDSQALDAIADLFRLNEDWSDISLMTIENIVNRTGRSTELYLICEECSECFDQEQYPEQENNNFICKQCTKEKEDSNE